MGHQAHLIVKCDFHLATAINGQYIVSTVGDYFGPDKKRESIGAGEDAFFETFVFPARPNTDDTCCPFVVSDWMEIDAQRYATGEEAHQGHIEFCTKYSLALINKEN